MKYGITNKEGKTGKDEVKKILELGKEHGLEGIDTAEAYGNAQEIIGEMHEITRKFKIQTKMDLNIQSGKESYTEEILDERLNNSLEKTGRKYFDTLLMHNYQDLRNLNTSKKEWLINKRGEGTIRNIGVSIYEGETLTDEDTKLVDLVQLPLSVYDQRLLIDGTISMLKQRNVRVQARSIFCQGLILTGEGEVPKIMSRDFEKHHCNVINRLKKEMISQIDMAILFAKSVKAIDSYVIGINNKAQLEEIIQSWLKEDIGLKGISFKDLAWNKEEIDPRTW